MITQSSYPKKRRFEQGGRLFFGLLCLHAGFVGAQELASNPGFETGNTTGWFAFGSPAISAQTVQVHSGSYAGLVTNRTATYMGIAQSFSGVLQPNQIYNISAWVRLVAGTSQTMQLTVQKTDGNGTSYSKVASGTASTTSWTQLSGQFTFTYSGTLSSLTLYAELPNSATAAYYIDDLSVQPADPLPSSGQVTVDWSNVLQRIDGFGGGVQFLSPATLDPVSNSIMDTLFGTGTNQLALTLLRIGIDPNNNWNNQLLDAQKAVAHGAGILATPWSPPASMKDNGSTISGSLLPEQYTNYAYYLNGFAAFMASNGAPLKVISIQNEPDFDATYDSCLWTPAQFQTFFHNVAGLITNAPVMMPESFQYDFTMSDPTLNDPVAAANVDFVGGHLYGVTTIQDYTNAHSKGKPTWMTEYLVNDQTIGAAVDTARQVNDCLTTGNMSAYIWWKAQGDANGVVDASGVPQKRGFVLSQWSAFVRPNDFRIGTTNTGPAFVSAFKNLHSGQFAIVAINTSSSTIDQTFMLQNFPGVGSVTPWITSSSLSRAAQAGLSVSNSTFAYSLPGQSVVTFVGQAVSNPAQPRFDSITASASGINLVISGDAGPDYTLLTS